MTHAPVRKRPRSIYRMQRYYCGAGIHNSTYYGYIALNLFLISPDRIRQNKDETNNLFHIFNAVANRSSQGPNIFSAVEKERRHSVSLPMGLLVCITILPCWYSYVYGIAVYVTTVLLCICTTCIQQELAICFFYDVSLYSLTFLLTLLGPLTR